MPGELIPIVLFISVAAVLIFRPLTKRIGKVIDDAHQKKSVGQDPQIQRLMQLMERLVDRMDRLEDRVDFAERMLERQRMAGSAQGRAVARARARASGDGARVTSVPTTRSRPSASGGTLMPPYDIAPFVLGMTLILSTAAVIIFRPLTKRLGNLIEARQRERQAERAPGSQELNRLTDVVNRLTDRIEALEERQDFAERLLDSLRQPESRARLNDPTKR